MGNKCIKMSVGCAKSKPKSEEPQTTFDVVVPQPVVNPVTKTETNHSLQTPPRKQVTTCNASCNAPSPSLSPTNSAAHQLPESSSPSSVAEFEVVDP